MENKIDIAFDSIDNIKQVNELSVVLYPDSFFYGLWDNQEILVKSDIHSISNFKKLLNIWKKNFDLNIVRLLSTVKPFVHVPQEMAAGKGFNSKFKNVYPVKNQNGLKDVDDFLREEISTLHYLDAGIVKELNKQNISFKTAHISTALANYSYLADTDLMAHVHENTLHICLTQNGQFQFYNQFHCEGAHDYLYYFLWVLDYFKLNPAEAKINIGGLMNEDSSILSLLRTYISEVNLIDRNLRLPSEHPKHYYYDLYLCKSCV